MRLEIWLAALVVSAGVVSPAPAKDVQAIRVGLIAQDGARLYARRSSHSASLATLVQQAQVDILARRGSWYHVRVWDSVLGWMERGDITFRRPWGTISTYHAPETREPVRATTPQRLRAVAITSAATPLRRSVEGPAIGSIPAGRTVVIRAWTQDSKGEIWYLTPAGWAMGASVLIPRVPAVSHGTGAIWAPIAGKGMWLTLGTVTDTDPAVLVTAARRDGITHLYVESAISPLGFHGRESVGPLIEAAHRGHIAVIAWVYPYLLDIAGDVALTREVAAYRSQHGQAFDGIAADLERNMDAWRIRAYSQLVRTDLGGRYLLVGVTYPPQSLPTYPFAEVARQYDVVAPMDYWRQTRSGLGLDYGGMRYGAAYSFRYALDSIRAIQQATGGRTAVAPIGQAFDDFGRLEMGPYAPSSAEVRGFLLGCQRAGALSVSFFQWMTVTSPEWQVIHDFRL